MEERSLISMDMQEQLCFISRHVYQGKVQSLRCQGQLYCLVRLGQGCPSPALLMALGRLWARSLWERSVLNLQPLLPEDNELAFGTAPPLGTQQVTLRQ